MSKQINLFNPALRPQRVVLPASQMLGVWALVLVLCGVWAGYEQMRASRLTAEAKSLAAREESLQTEIKTLGAQLGARKVSAEVEARLRERELVLKDRHEAMSVLEAGGLGDTTGHSRYLRAFARQSVGGLWLTGLTVTGAGSDIQIEGRTLNAELVPDYLKRLSKESVLSGRSFNDLSMRRPEVHELKHEAEEQPASPAFVEFTLATQIAANDVKNGASR